MMRYKGFTLIEIAIVIVIIGIVLAGVIKASGLIGGSKVSNAITLAQDISVAVNSFKQQYHMLPGDISISTTTPEIPNVRAECAAGGTYEGNNNGLIDNGKNGSAGSLGVPAESQCIPELIFRAGLAKADQDGGWYVFKSYYGPVNIVATNLSKTIVTLGSNPLLPSISHVIEFQNLPCEVAIEIDRKMDNDSLLNGKAVASVPACVTGNIVTYAVAL
jgi:prepilin-type N-terminal cleavage/methylation domain-containing protein